MLSSWLRAIRIRFLLASIIAVSTGLAISWWTGNSITIFDAVLTFLGVLALHASVDLLNDYWDFKRGIDSKTVKTKMSGGSGVLPEGLLDPKHVYRAGIIFLIIGALIGTYFVVTDGIIIGVILAFAILSIYFYSTKIVNWGLAEVFVSIKGTLIVIGTYFIQTSQINESVIFGGIVRSWLVVYPVCPHKNENPITINSRESFNREINFLDKKFIITIAVSILSFTANRVFASAVLAIFLGFNDIKGDNKRKINL